jgi:hypothetical protein
MLKTQELQSPVLEIGEDIGFELGKKMVQDFQSLHPLEIPSFLVGKNILTQILNQPGCEGIRMYNGYNEKGEKTLVYVGTDKNAKNIFEITCIDSLGVLSNGVAIVADRVKPGGLPMGRPGDGSSLASPDDWEWAVD